MASESLSGHESRCPSRVTSPGVPLWSLVQVSLSGHESRRPSRFIPVRGTATALLVLHVGPAERPTEARRWSP